MSEVLNILKRRVYFGQEHSTKLPHLQQAEREILDWVDKQTEQAVRELCQRTAIQAGEMLAALATPPDSNGIEKPLTPPTTPLRQNAPGGRDGA